MQNDFFYRQQLGHVQIDPKDVDERFHMTLTGGSHPAEGVKKIEENLAQLRIPTQNEIRLQQTIEKMQQDGMARGQYFEDRQAELDQAIGLRNSMISNIEKHLRIEKERLKDVTAQENQRQAEKDQADEAALRKALLDRWIASGNPASLFDENYASMRNQYMIARTMNNASREAEYRAMI